MIALLNLCLAAGLPAAAVPQDPPKLTAKARIEPENAKPGDRVVLVITADVEIGYHAYGTKERVNTPVSLDPSKLELHGLVLDGPADIPPGEEHEVFGDKTYPLPPVFDVRQALRVPGDLAAGEIEISGILDYQVCDENMCLPPEGAPFEAKLRIESPGGATADRPEAVPSPRAPPIPAGVLGFAKLTVESSFEPRDVPPGSSVRLILRASVLPGYHAYGTKETRNIPVGVDLAKLDLGPLELDGPVVIPPGEPKDVLGATAWLLPPVFEVEVPLRVPPGTSPGSIPVVGVLDYQVCDENSCDPLAGAPFRAELTVSAAGAAGADPAGPDRVGPGAQKAPESVDGVPNRPDLWLLLLLCVGGGLFALAMPCTYPMIPITFSFFTKQAEKKGGSVLPLAIAYGLGIVLMFTVVGAALSAVIVDVVNHWITNAVIALVFLFFSFVLFGWVNLQPPAFLQRAAGKAGQAGGYLGVFFMGATLVISSFTCTAPIVGTLLGNVASYGVPTVALGMAVFGLTMAAPFVFLALMPARVKEMPRSGEWMETLKVSLGFVELAATLKFVSMVDFALAWRVLPRELFLMLWAAIFALWAMYLFGAIRKKGAAIDGVGNGRMAAGIAVFLLAAYFFFGAMGFKLDFFMTNFVPGYSAQSVLARADASGSRNELAHLGQHEIVLDDQEAAVAAAKRSGKLLLYNFTGFN
ncbi:MAG: hypothetical protein Fur0037_04050 [Planctomycetota bacterium]